MNKVPVAFYIGRFQLLNKAHLSNIKSGLEIADRLVLFLGSANKRDYKNPYSVEEREQMIRLCLTEEENERTSFVSLNDMTSDEEWVQYIQNSLGEHKESAVLIGTDKDASSYYLKLFPNKIIELPVQNYGDIPVSSTLARDYLSKNDMANFRQIVPDEIYKYFLNK